MKSLTEFLDGLDQVGLEYIRENVDWIDLEAPCRIKHVEIPDNFTADIVKELHDKIMSDCSYSLYLAHIMKILMVVNKLSSETYSNRDVKEAIKHYGTERDSAFLFYLAPIDTLAALQAEVKNKIENRTRYGNKPNLSFSEILLNTDDYDDINYEYLDLSGTSIENVDKLMHIVPKEIILAKFRSDSSQLSHNYIKRNVDCDLFDELFFCENGWSEENRKKWISQYKPVESDVEDFMSRIVSVDFSYMQYLDLIIQRDPAVAARLYKMKKPDAELTGNESVEMTFRYPRSIRKLFQLAAVCSRENIGKAMTGLLADMSTMIKFYGYNYQLIFHAMYPECFSDSEENAEELTA